MTERVFEGRDFLITAAWLAERSDDEGALRSAISRAYYACFHRVRTLADAQSVPIRRDGSAHVAVRRFIATVDPSLEFELSRLHRLRKHADYDMPFPAGDPRFIARSAVAKAAEIIGRIDALAGDKPRGTRET